MKSIFVEPNEDKNREIFAGIVCSGHTWGDIFIFSVQGKFLD